MSETLKGQVPELEQEAINRIEGGYVTIVLERVHATSIEPIVGILSCFQSGAEPEVDVKLTTDEGFEIVNAVLNPNAELMKFNSIQLHKGETIIELKGPYYVKNVRLSDIDPVSGMCLLVMKLIMQTTESL